jgi:hypothetical protein
MLDRTKQLLTHPDAEDPRNFLADVLHSALELLSLPDNDFVRSGSERKNLVAEIEAVIALVEAGELPERSSIALLFAPTGALQEFSISSGWAGDFLKVAERFDRAEQRLWQ